MHAETTPILAGGQVIKSGNCDWRNSFSQGALPQFRIV
jgi:hypothetical protein